MSYELTEEQRYEINRDTESFRKRATKAAEYKNLAKQKRLDKGYKTNIITSHELRLVILDWLSNGRCNLKKSFIHIYNTTNKTNKEVDWVKSILNAKHYGKELTTAFNSIVGNSSIELLKSSKLFNVSRFKSGDTLSKRIRQMDSELKYEEIIIEKEERIATLESQLASAQKITSWQEKALELLSKGMTQKEVAITVGKGLATISRLVKNNKKVEDERIPT